MSKRSQTHVQTRTSTWVAVGLSAALALAAGFAGYLATNPDGLLCKTYPKFCASFTGYSRSESTTRSDYQKDTAKTTYPDLQITSFVYNESDLSLTFEFTNRGDEAISWSEDVVFALTSPVGTMSLYHASAVSDYLGYEVFMTSQVKLTDVPIISGEYKICADSDETIAESSEDNNCATVTVE